MRIASFNLENLTDKPTDGISFRARVDLLRPQLQRLSADILCLQEVDASKPGTHAPRRLDALHQLIETTAYEEFHVVSTLDESSGHPRDRHNLVILSRWPIAAHAQYRCDLLEPPCYRRTTSLPADPSPVPVAWDRPILHVTIDRPDAVRLHVVNMHLRAPLAAPVPGQKRGPFSWNSVQGWAEGYLLAAMKRAGQALEARLLVDRLFDEDPKALILLAGDFNSEEREVPLRIVTGNVEDTGNGHLAGRGLVLLEHSLPAERCFTVIHRGQKQMLDHILVSHQLMGRYRGIEVHNEALGDELVAYSLTEAAPESYHAPIVASFEFP